MASTHNLRSVQHPPPSHAARVLQLPGPASACPLCGSRETGAAFRDNGFSLRVCKKCDLFFVHPYPGSDQQHQQVSSGVYGEIEILDCARRYQGERLFYDRHLDLIAEEVRSARSVLDVGCGTGNLLERLAANPELDRAGIELNAQAARFARKTAGCPVWEVPVEQFRTDRKFDVVTMINVFSHIPTFDGLFQSLRAVVRPGGRIILRTSEMRSNVSRWNQVHWGIPDDLHFLGLGTLDFICAKYGFSVVRHIRTPFEDELFRRSRWEQMGRSRVRNFVKKAGTRIPLALPGLKTLYTAALGQRLYVSFIVLVPLERSTNRGMPKVAHMHARRNMRSS